MQYIECTIFNKETNLELPIDLKSDTNITLFLSEKELKETGQFVYIDSDYIKWILTEDKYKKVFEKVADFVGLQTEDFIKVFLTLIAKEDKDGYNFLCKSKFSKKECFLKTFEDFMNDFMDIGVKNVIAPDILLCAICHCIFQNTNNQTIEIPIDILPYILGVDEEKPEEYPKDFDPNIVYDNNAAFKNS